MSSEDQPIIRKELRNHEEERIKIAQQCGKYIDVLTVNFRYDSICEALTIFKSKGLTLKKLFRVQKDLPFIYPWNTEYDTLRFNVNRRFNIFPLIILMASTKDQVISGYRFARRYKIDISLRGGSHCFENFSLTNGMVIDQSRRTKISVNPTEREVTIEPGVLLGPLAAKLSKYNLVLPSGTCSNNAATGYSLGGGIGFLTRKYSVTCDSILEARILLANETVIKTDSRSYPDLFFALKGAGIGNYGIILSLKFRVYPIKDVTIFTLTYRFNRIKEVLDQWQHWSLAVDNDLTSEFKCYNNRGNPIVTGIYLGDEEKLRSILKPLLDLNPKGIEIRTVPYLESARHFADVGRWFLFFKAKNAFINRVLPPEFLQIVEDNLAIGTGNDTFALDSMGGAVDDLSSDESAFVHRRGIRSWMLINARWDEQDQGPIHYEWVTNFYNRLIPYLSGQVYQNAPDLDLPNSLDQYYRWNLGRLSEIKTKYDPANIFQYSQSIPVL
jgi:hypothetical protein